MGASLLAVAKSIYYSEQELILRSRCTFFLLTHSPLGISPKIEPFSGQKSENLPQNPPTVMHFIALISLPETTMTAAILLFNSLAGEF